MKALSAEGYSYEAVVPSGFIAPPGVQSVSTPASLAGGSNLSLLRPIKWLAYSRFRFPVSKSKRVLCTTHHVLPGRRHQIVTVHDLRPYFFPDTPVQSFYFRHMLPRVLRSCDGILTVSETSRQLIATVYNIPLDRIAVVSNVIEPPKGEGIHSSPDMHDPFLLVVGASWPHKNVESLLKQYTLWSSLYRVNIVAGNGQYRTSLEKLAQTLGITPSVRFLENISSEKLHQLYTDCSALIAPSRMEGFGLPPLEAMVRRRPVIVSDIPVFRELYGHHAIFVDTEDTASWERAFAALRTVSTRETDAAEQHALSYNRARMALSLKNAIQKFWAKTI